MSQKDINFELDEIVQRFVNEFKSDGLIVTVECGAPGDEEVYISGIHPDFVEILNILTR